MNTFQVLVLDDNRELIQKLASPASHINTTLPEQTGRWCCMRSTLK